MANICSKRMVKAFEKFNADLDAFLRNSDESPLYEDAFTPREVSNFRLTLAGALTWKEDGHTEREVMFDDDEANDWLKFWKACLRRAKKYWSMDCETLDAIHDFKKEDITIEED